MIFPLISKRPVLLVGNGVRSAEAQALILQFAVKTDIPVLTTMNAVDLVQDNLKIGFIGTYGNRIANNIVSACDLLISVGARLGLRQVGRDPKNFAPQAKLIRADIDDFELSRSVKEDEVKYLIDAKEFMTKLLDEDIPKYTMWRKSCLEAKHILENEDLEIGNKVIEAIGELLPQNPIVAVDIGQSQCWAAQSLILKGDQGRILIGGGYGSMGCGLPYAIGASIAEQKKTVFCITGDGGLQMNIQELEAVVREHLPIKIFVLNNHALGKISEVQCKACDGRYAQTTTESGYTVPDFTKVAKAYGIKAKRCSTYHELKDIALWLKDDDPCLIDITLPTDTKLIPKMDWSTGAVKPDILPEQQELLNDILMGV